MNGLVQQAIEQQLLTVAQRVEDQLDDQLHAIDKLDADDIEALRLQVCHTDPTSKHSTKFLVMPL